MPDCFSSLKKIDKGGDEVKQVLVDNTSDDDCVDYVLKNFSEVKVIKNKENLGFAAGNNVGMRWALDHGFDYVVLLNDDTVVDKHWLVEMKRVMDKQENIAAVQSKVLLHSDKRKINSWGNNIHFLGFGYAGGYLEPDQKMEAREITYASGSSVMYRAAVLREIGLLEEQFFMYHEDLEMGMRIKLAGLRSMLAPKSIMYHKYSFSKSMKKYYDMERNRFITIFSYYKWQTLFLIFLPLIIMELGLFGFSLTTGWWKEKLRVYNYFLNDESWQKIGARRAELKKIRKVSDRKLMHGFVGKIEFQDISNPLLDKVVNPVYNFYWQILKNIMVW